MVSSCRICKLHSTWLPYCSPCNWSACCKNCYCVRKGNAVSNTPSLPLQLCKLAPNCAHILTLTTKLHLPSLNFQLQSLLVNSQQHSHDFLRLSLLVSSQKSCRSLSQVILDCCCITLLMQEALPVRAVPINLPTSESAANPLFTPGKLDLGTSTQWVNNDYSELVKWKRNIF